MSCVHHAVHAGRQASHPYDFMAWQKLIICLPFVPAEQLLLNVTASSCFSALNMQIANQNVLKRILIAMQDENKANYNMFRGIHRTPVQVVGIIRPVGT